MLHKVFWRKEKQLAESFPCAFPCNVFCFPYSICLKCLNSVLSMSPVEWFTERQGVIAFSFFNPQAYCVSNSLFLKFHFTFYKI